MHPCSVCGQPGDLIRNRCPECRKRPTILNRAGRGIGSRGPRPTDCFDWAELIGHEPEFASEEVRRAAAFGPKTLVVGFWEAGFETWGQAAESLGVAVWLLAKWVYGERPLVWADEPLVARLRSLKVRSA